MHYYIIILYSIVNYHSKLIKAKFIKRYKRFFSDHLLPNNKVITAYCPNTGSMKGLLIQGSQSFLSQSLNTNRKLNYTWEQIKIRDTNIGINTQLANKVIYENIRKFDYFKTTQILKIEREVKYGKNCKIDFLITDKNKKKIWVEVKSVTLSRQEGIAEFPDSATSRGSKQFIQLKQKLLNEQEVIIIYLIQRKDCNNFKLASDIDMKYSRLYTELKELGLKSIAVNCDILDNEIKINFRKKVKILDE